MIPDPRTNRHKTFLYPIEEIFFLVISAVLSSANHWTSIEIFGKGQLTWLRKFFPFSHGIPSHDTLGRLFARLDPARFEQCFREWINERHQLTHGEVIASDGKRMRGSYDLQDRKSAIHMVSAYASEQRLCLGQLATEEKSNEITAIPKLLDTLMLEGATITIDAMGCQKNIFKKIVAKQADYILQVKNNQKGLLAQIEKVFSLTPGTDVHQTQELDHGRVEQRTCTVVEDLTLLDDDHGWPGLATLIRIEAQRTEKQSGKTTTSTRYYISSKKEKARIFNANIRAHWRIENNLHWMLDVLFKEDARGYSAENFSIINKMALTLIERNTDKIPKSQKIQRATYNSQYREKLLNF